jgi:hypothetical protein
MIISGPRDVAYFICNTLDYVYCFEISVNGINQLAVVPRINGRACWIEGGDLYIAGMRTRVRKVGRYWFMGGEWYSLKRGVNALIKVKLSDRRLSVVTSIASNRRLAAEWKAKIAFKDDAMHYLEAWLDSVNIGSDRILVGGVADRCQSDWDTVFEAPRPNDFEGSALYQWSKGKVKLIRVLCGMRYVGKLKIGDEIILYFFKNFNDRNNYFAMRISEGLQSELMPLSLGWEKDGTSTIRFEPKYEENVGAFSVATTSVRDVAPPHPRVFSKSADGINWSYICSL